MNKTAIKKTAVTVAIVLATMAAVNRMGVTNPVKKLING